jgi:hypothetical protein
VVVVGGTYLPEAAAVGTDAALARFDVAAFVAAAAALVTFAMLLLLLALAGVGARDISRSLAVSIVTSLEVRESEVAVISAPALAVISLTAIVCSILVLVAGAAAVFETPEDEASTGMWDAVETGREALAERYCETGGRGGTGLSSESLTGPSSVGTQSCRSFGFMSRGRADGSCGAENKPSSEVMPL